MGHTHGNKLKRCQRCRYHRTTKGLSATLLTHTHIFVS